MGWLFENPPHFPSEIRGFLLVEEWIGTGEETEMQKQLTARTLGSAGMLDTIRDLFDFATSGAKVVQELTKVIKRRKGKSRLLLEELKENQDLCLMVLGEGTDPMLVLPKLKADYYNQLLAEGFNFNSVKREKISTREKLEKSDLSYLIGKSTGFLIEDIYDKVKELQRRFEIDKNNRKIQWRRRIINLYKRIVLLVDHLRG